MPSQLQSRDTKQLPQPSQQLNLHILVEGEGFEPSYSERADLQSAAFNHSATPPKMSPRLSTKSNTLSKGIYKYYGFIMRIDFANRKSMQKLPVQRGNADKKARKATFTCTPTSSFHIIACTARHLFSCPMTSSRSAYSNNRLLRKNSFVSNAFYARSLPH